MQNPVGGIGENKNKAQITVLLYGGAGGGGVGTIPIMHQTDSDLHHLVSFNLQGGQKATRMRVKLESGGKSLSMNTDATPHI